MNNQLNGCMIFFPFMPTYVNCISKTSLSLILVLKYLFHKIPSKLGFHLLLLLTTLVSKAKLCATLTFRKDVKSLNDVSVHNTPS